MAPIKRIRVKGNTQEWFDDEIHCAINIRDKHFSAFKRSKSNEDKLSYKRAQNRVQNLIKKRKRQFVKGKLENNVGKPKELWKTLKSLGFSKTEVSASKTCLEREGRLSFDPKENSEIFKDFFSNLATNLVSKLPPAPKKFGMDTVEAYYKNNITSTAFFTFLYLTSLKV